MGQRYLSWLKQAEKDIEWAKDSLEHGHFAQSCFIAQQIGEKTLKALAYFKGHEIVKSHSIVKIAQELKINGEIANAGQRLDLYYISARYPDAVPDSGIPSDYFNHEQAKEALDYAKLIFIKVNKLINENP